MVGVTGGRTGLRGCWGMAPAVPRTRWRGCAWRAAGRPDSGLLGSPRPPPRTRALGGHTKGTARRGEARRAGRGAVQGRPGPDEVAGPRRPPRPRLCLPGSAPPAKEPRRPRRRQPARYPDEEAEARSDDWC
ncbi:uncharacterized protein V5649_021317 [Rhynchonycteris naso]